MTLPWRLRIFDRQTLVHTEDLAESLELGRQDEGEEGPYFKTRSGATWRLVVANREERSISRSHVLLEALDQERARITNLSTSMPLHLANGRELQPRAAAEEALPVTFNLGRRTFALQNEESLDAPLQSLAVSPAAPGTILAGFWRLPGLSKLPESDVRTKELIRWLQATMGVFQSAASSLDFLALAAQAVVEITAMDSARVLVLDEAGQWQTRATHGAANRGGARRPSRNILARVQSEKRTFWQLPEVEADLQASLVGVHAVVAAPILDRHGAVIGALYGDRRYDGLTPDAGPITELEAMLVELLASGIAAGLARLEQEQAALEARVRFEQFFTPDFARQLAEQPDLLRGRESEVTVLFVDIVGFSRICEKLGPARSFDWISDTLGELSACVLAGKGVLVDYVGDELLAMWGAPGHQPDHARRACRAALDMVARLPELNRRWQATLDEPIQVRIGINTGKAWVGNTGSRQKFKYGPLGNTVNLGSRVQGATKYLHANVLLTGATSALLDDEFARRRLCNVRVVNIAQPVELYELAPSGQPGWADMRREYEEALAAFEGRDYAGAARILSNLRVQFPNDGPALVLLSRAVNAMLDKNRQADAVWELPGK